MTRLTQSELLDLHNLLLGSGSARAYRTGTHRTAVKRLFDHLEALDPWLSISEAPHSPNTHIIAAVPTGMGYWNIGEAVFLYDCTGGNPDWYWSYNHSGNRADSHANPIRVISYGPPQFFKHLPEPPAVHPMDVGGAA